MNTVHSSFISLGIMLGSAIGSALIPGYGLRAPLVLGIGMGVLAVTATVNIHPRDGGFELSVNLNLELTGLSQSEAEDLVEAADEVCPYSHATCGSITVTHTVHVS